MDAEVERRMLGLIGLGIRGRLAVVGVERVREAARAGRLRFAVIAADASHHSREKVERLLAARAVPTVRVESAATLGAVAGRDATAVIGVVDAKLATGIRAVLGSGTAMRSGSRRNG